MIAELGGHLVMQTAQEIDVPLVTSLSAAESARCEQVIFESREEVIAELGGHLVMQTAQEIDVTEDVHVDVRVTSLSPNNQQHASAARIATGLMATRNNRSEHQTSVFTSPL